MNLPSEPARRPARLQLMLVVGLFLGPLLFAAWMYYGGSAFAPASRSNHGQLLEPIRHLAARYPEIESIAPGQWLLVYAPAGECDAACQDAIHRQKQSRLMLGNDMNRLTRVFLHGDWPADTVPHGEQQSGLKIIASADLVQELWSATSRSNAHDGFFLIDPLGNLVMYFAPHIDPRDMVDDIKHLLELSQIG